MIQQFDNVLSNFEEYKKQAKQINFTDVVSQGNKYRDMSQDISGDILYTQIEKLMGFKPIDKINFLRAYKDNYKNPTWIHTDVLFSDFIGIFFIQSSDFWQDDGVSFWYNKELGVNKLDTKTHIGKENEIVDSQTLDPNKWTMYHRVEFNENRLVVAPASYFHSKSTYGNYGKTNDDCRIVHVLFFDKG